MRNRHIVLTLALLISLAKMASAQSTEFTYQGRLLFGDVPANGNYDFEFALFDAATAGNQLGSTFPLSAVNVNNGVFSVRVDFGDQFPGSSRFLEIHVRQTGNSVFAVLSPRQAISSAPYAIKSLNAANSDNATNANQLGGVTANQFVVTGDARLSDARNPLPNSAYYIQNATSQQALSNFNISGTGTANIFNTATQYNIGGRAVLSMPGSGNLFAGVTSGQANTTGAFNAFFGTAAGSANTSGGSNSAFGNFAGNANTTGSSNSYFGFGSGSANTSASGNSFFGASAGALSTGGSNSFFGASSGVDNTTGASNSFFGLQSGTSNTTGSGNSFVGIDAGQSNTTGSDNVFFGGQTGSNNITGSANTAIGTSANVAAGNLSFATAIGAGSTVATSNTVVLGRPSDGVTVPGSLTVNGATTLTGTFTANSINTTGQFSIGGSTILSNAGSSNLFAGVLSGNQNTGSSNSFFGSLSGTANTSGSENSFFGASSGHFTSTGTRNAFFGAFSGQLNSTGFSNAMFGWSAGTSNSTGSENAFFGAGSGANTTTGSNNSFIGTSAGPNNTVGSFNSALGYLAGFRLTSGSDNLFLGDDTGQAMTTESANSFVGSLSNGAAGITNATAVGFRSQVTQSNSLVLGSINGKNGATADTRVGIGTTAPGKHLHVLGAGDQEIAIQSSDSGGRMWTLQSSQGTSNGRFEIIDRTANASRLAIDLNGNVGISDSTPSAKLDIAVNSGHVLFGDAGCNAGFTGIGFGTTLSGCANFSLLGNGTDTILNRPTGGVLAFRENNTTQLSIASGGIVSITTLGSGGTSALCRNASGQISTCAAIQGEGSDTFVKSPNGSVHLRTLSGDLTLAPSGTVTTSGLLSIGLVPGGGSQNLCLAGTTVSLCSSSIRYKTDIKYFRGGLDLVKQLRPVTFSWKSDNSRDVGLVAEDVARIDPLFVTRNSNGEVEGVKYDRVGVVLVNAVNEQQVQIESQQKQINAQKETIERQQAEINALKKLVCSRNHSASLCRSPR